MKRSVCWAITVILVATLLVVVGGSAPASATLPVEFDKTVILNGLNDPTSFRFAPNGDMYILEQAGAIKLFRNGVVTTIGTVPTVNDHEKGALGLELDKNFATNHYIYVSYTHVSGYARLSRFTVVNDTLDMNSEFVFYQSDQVASIYHNANDIHYGPDGKIWWSIGDNLATGNSQSLQTIHGKIARFDVDGTSANDNPWHGQANLVDQIYALGFRNPFRFTFLPNGKAVVGDVGGASWEEIDAVQSGANYGWPMYEGDCGACGYANPLFAYPHDGLNSAISALAWYDGTTFPTAYQNVLFYGDYARHTIRYLKLDSSYSSVLSDNAFDDAAGTVVDMHQGPDGNLYYASIFEGEIVEIAPSGGDRAPEATATADTIAGLAPLTVNFSSAGTFDPDGDPLTYSWDFGDGTTSTDPNPQHVYTTNGTYDAVLTVSDGQKTSVVSVKITVGNRLPTATITTPMSGTHYNAGDTISYSATASDPEDGTLPESAYSWKIVFHHADHVHPYLGPLDGASSGSFTIGHDATNEYNTWYRIELTVTDSGGLQYTTYRDILPNLVNFTVQTDTPGTMFSIDGNLFTSYNEQQVVGVDHGLAVVSPQFVGGDKYRFLSWSDGGAATHTYRVPATDSQLNVDFYQAVPVPSPWTTADIGNPVLVGNADYDAQRGAFVLDGGGTDLWSTADQGRYVTQPLSGNGEIVARVTSQTAANDWTKSGIIIRESTAQFAPYAMVAVTPANGIVMQYSVGKNAGPRPAYTFPVWLKLRRDGNIFTSSYSSDGQSWTQLGQATVAMAKDAVVGMFAVSHTNAAMTTTVFDNVQMTPLPTPGPVPAPWTTADIGNPAIAGDATYLSGSGTFSLTGSGADLWGTTDQGRYVTQPLSGDGEIVARMTSETATNNWTKSGIIVRESTTPLAPYAMIAVTPGNGVVMQYSVSKNAGPRPAYTFPTWLKLRRAGNVFTSWYSFDGQSWTQLGQATVAMAKDAVAGMFMVSHDNTKLATSTFDNVSVTPLQLPGPPPAPWQQADIGVVTPGPGSAMFDPVAQSFSVTGGGYDIYTTHDDFHYVYQPLNGDGSITARVTSQTNTNTAAKAGVMIKESPVAFAPYSLLAETPAKGLKFQWSFLPQSKTGGTYPPPVWLRLTRVGDVITSYSSTDGTTWTVIGSKTVAMASTATIGLFVTSHNSGALSTATFDHVTVVP